ncbi:MAG: chemotaxis protein CheD [bacterium]|nr:chemotaxis protein CheD [bacterium]
MYKKLDRKLNKYVITIYPGEMYISTEHEILSTVLGSCIAVCLYDTIKKIGGMNHFVLPVSSLENNKLFVDSSCIKKEQLSEESMRYGITAMDTLIAEMQKKGATRLNLVAKIFGGGNVLTRGGSTRQSVGDKNIDFARAYLKMEKIKISKEDVGRDFGRKIFFMTEKGSVFVKKVGFDPIEKKEQEYLKKLLEIKRKSDVTIF